MNKKNYLKKIAKSAFKNELSKIAEYPYSDTDIDEAVDVVADSIADSIVEENSEDFQYDPRKQLIPPTFTQDNQEDEFSALPMSDYDFNG